MDELTDEDEEIDDSLLLDKYQDPRYQDEEENLTGERLKRRNKISQLIKTDYKNELDQLHTILMSDHPSKKEDIKARKDRIHTLVRKILKDLKERGVSKVEAKGPLLMMLRGWQHDYLVKKYSTFVDIP